MDTVREVRGEHAALAAELADAGVQFALGGWVDITGRAKSKLVPIGNLAAMLAGSERYTPRGIGDLGRMNPSEDECVGVPDPGTLRVLPWEPRIAFYNADLSYGGREPFACCPRSALRAVLDRAAGLGYRFNLGVETEFYVYRADALPELVPLAASSRLRPTPAYDVQATLDSLDFLGELVGHLQASGFGVFSLDHEGGEGQYELDFAHADALTTCDRLTYLRLLLRHVAAKAGGIVTFMPKPSASAWGSGAHMNMSLESTSDDRNLFVAAGSDGQREWQPAARQFLAGLLRHAPALAALTCPTVNSYKRLVPTLVDGGPSWAPVWAAYGVNNRSCMLRLPENRPAIENRSVDMTANMYLASAFALAAGLEGIEQELDPGPPVTADTSLWPRHGDRHLPRTLAEAIEAFAADPLVAATFPADLVSSYVDMKRREWDDYHAVVTGWELDRYLLNI
ncbi:MAG TPA: glutamate--ammonia ligase [Mycobacteriales bacterium]|nr:glutamate--ammonia ligase [Mycobacteriales bacterium]